MATEQKAEYYSVAEVVKLLDVSPSTVWRWIEAKRLPAYRVGPKTIRIKKEDLGKVLAPAGPRGHEVSANVRKANAAVGAPSPAEIARRQALVSEILALRKQAVISPVTTADLVRQVRQDAEGSYGSSP